MSMTKKLKIISVKKDTIIQTGEPFLDVSVEISSFNEEGKLIGFELKKYGYPIGTSAEAILADLKKVLEASIIESQRALEEITNAEIDYMADQTINQLQEAVIE